VNYRNEKSGTAMLKHSTASILVYVLLQEKAVETTKQKGAMSKAPKPE
jgi:hypothetical protein